MPQSLIDGVVAILLAVISVATLALILSPRAKTTDVIRAGAGGFSQILSAATAPVTGGGMGGFSSSF